MLVLDTLFVNALTFELTATAIAELGPSRSLQEHWTKCCAAVGIELIEYAYVQDRYDPWLNLHSFEVMGSAWVKSKKR